MVKIPRVPVNYGYSVTLLIKSSYTLQYFSLANMCAHKVTQLKNGDFLLVALKTIARRIVTNCKEGFSLTCYFAWNMHVFQQPAKLFASIIINFPNNKCVQTFVIPKLWAGFPRGCIRYSRIIEKWRIDLYHQVFPILARR